MGKNNKQLWPKWYVKNGDLEILVTAKTAMDATAEALSYMGFPNATEVPAHIFRQKYFGVSSFGFRQAYPAGLIVEKIRMDDSLPYPLDGTDLRVNYGKGKIPSTMFAEFEFSIGEVLEWFDEKCDEFDPFCERGNTPSDPLDATDEFFYGYGEAE